MLDSISFEVHVFVSDKSGGDGAGGGGEEGSGGGGGRGTDGTKGVGPLRTELDDS